jgi:hypothetical protein
MITHPEQSHAGLAVILAVGGLLFERPIRCFAVDGSLFRAEVVQTYGQGIGR